MRKFYSNRGDIWLVTVMNIKFSQIRKTLWKAHRDNMMNDIDSVKSETAKDIIWNDYFYRWTDPKYRQNLGKQFNISLERIY